MTPKEALKGRKVFVYARVSGAKQEGTIPDQIKTIKEGLKKLGFKGKPVVYSEQFSGTKNPLEDAKFRPELGKLLKEVLMSKKPSVIVVRDIQRFSRDPYDLGELYNPLRRAEIPIISINEDLVLGTKNVPQPNADLFAPLLVTIGGTEVSTRKVQTKQGLQRSKEKGILQGTAPLMYRKDVLEPRREMLRLMKVVDSNGKSLSGREISKRIGKSTSFYRKNKAKFEKLLLEGGDELLNDYLDTIDLVRNFMNEKNEDVRGSKATVRMKTVVRMTSGYLNNPNAGFPKPTREDIEEYYNNFNEYKKKVL